MATLADFAFDRLKAGMRFSHPQHGEQVILDLGRSALGPTIQFDNCPVYNGEMPALSLGESTEDAEDIFHLLSKTTYPAGAEAWRYLGELTDLEVVDRGWRWYAMACPHCGSTHRYLGAGPRPRTRACLSCGMSYAAQGI
jgi:hypothetical protein